VYRKDNADVLLGIQTSEEVVLHSV